MSGYLVRMEHPHEWWSDRYVSCFDREEAETYAKDHAHGTYGHEGYVRTTAYVTLEELDRLIRKAKHDAWAAGYSAGSQDGSIIGVGKTNNPYKEES